MNINENQMLASFSEDFVKFRDEFLNIRNEDYRHERNNDLGDMQAKQNVSIAEHDREIEAKKREIAAAENDISLTNEARTELKTRLEAELHNLEDAKKVDQEYVDEQEDKYYGTKDEIREKLRTLVANFKEKLGYNNVFGTQMSKIDVLKSDINNRIVSISYQFETIRQQLYATKNNGDRKPLAVEMQKLIDERKRLVALVANLEKFERLFFNVEKYVEDVEVIEDMDLRDISESFEEIAESVVVDVDKTLISVDIITNDDGSYSLDMRCGNKVCDPRPVIPADKFNKNEVDSYLKGFVNAIAAKTKMTVDELTSSNVILKSNGMDLGRHQYKNIGELSEKVRDGKRDEILAAVGKTAPGEPTPGQPAPGEPVSGQPAPGEPVPGEPTPGQPAPGQPVPGQPAPGEPVPGEPVPGEPTPGEPTPGEPNPTQGQSDDDELNQTQDIDDHLLKIINKRNKRTGIFSKAKTAALVATVGLGIAGVTLGIGTGLAATSAILGVGAAASEGVINLVERAKYGSMRSKLKSVAKKMSKETGLDIRYYEDLNTRKAGYVLGDSKDILTSEDLSALAQGQDDQILDIFDHAFEKANAYRGKGDNAGSNKEFRYRNFPRITFDNCEAAFEEWGGLKSRKERKQSKFSFGNIIKSRKKAQEAEEELSDDDIIEGVDADEITTGLQEGSELTPPTTGQPVPGQPIPGQPVPGQPTPGEPVPGEPTPGEPVPGQPVPGEPVPGQPVPEPQPEPTVVQPLAAPVAQPDDVTALLNNLNQTQYENQEIYQQEIVDKVRASVTDQTNNAEVSNALNGLLRDYGDVLAPENKVNLVNMFHSEVGFTQEQMDQLGLICNGRTKSNAEIQETIAQLEGVRRSQGEGALGEAIASYLSANPDLTKADLEALEQFDTSKNMGFKEVINTKFNGQGPRL